MNNMNIYENLELMPLDLQGWNGNSDVFKTLIEKTNPTQIIEVGSWKGQSAINMGNFIQSTNRSTKILCIDTWLGAIEFYTSMKDTTGRDLLLKNGYPQIYYQFLSNVVHNNLQDVIEPFPNTSMAGYWYCKYNKITADLIYIDASHEETDVYNDISNYYDLLNPKGIIFGDDFTNDWSGVKSAVNKFCSENNIACEILENNFWVIRK